ncbi:mitochondrial Rho GTPase [Trifolium repens]|nr:mitochondrial Rho GTPase [Trifolium repens]
MSSMLLYKSHYRQCCRWQRAKNLPYRPTWGAAISEYGAVLHKIGHGRKPETHHQYPPWCHHGLMVVMSFHRSSNNISMCFFFPLYKNEENSYGSCQYRFVTAVFLNLCNCNFG